MIGWVILIKAPSELKLHNQTNQFYNTEEFNLASHLQWKKKHKRRKTLAGELTRQLTALGTHCQPDSIKKHQRSNDRFEDKRFR